MFKIRETLTHTVIFRTTDSAWIPCDEANADYREYLAWVAEGNEPEPWEPAEQE